MRILKKFASAGTVQFVKFCFVGAMNTIVSLVVYQVLIFFGLNYLIANFIAFIVGALNSYFFNNLFVFINNSKTAAKLARTAVMSLTSLLLSTVVIYTCVSYLHISEVLSPFPTIIITTIYNFLLSKFWVYRNRKNKFWENELAEEPLVTICIPTYNREDTIRETLESVYNQTYKNIEVFIVDDASKDSTIQIAKEYDCNIVVNETNLGSTGNFNKGLKLGSGKYIKILCSDDLLMPNAIELMVKAFESHPTVSICTSATDIVDMTGNLMFKRSLGMDSTRIDGDEMARRSLILGRNLWGEPSNVLLRRSAVERAGEFNNDFYYMVDWEYWISISNFGDTFYINEPLSSFRLNTVSETAQANKHSKDDVMSKKFELLINKYAEKYNVNRVYKYFAKLSNRFRNFLRRRMV